MPDSYYTEKLLGLQEVSIKKFNDTKIMRSLLNSRENSVFALPGSHPVLFYGDQNRTQYHDFGIIFFERQFVCQRQLYLIITIHKNSVFELMIF